MIVARYRTGQDFLGAWFDEGRLGGFFVPTRRALEVGAVTPVEVRFEDGKIFRTRCRVVWRRVGGDPHLPAGLGLEFLSTEGHVRDLLLDYAQGRPIPYRERTSRRVPAEVQVVFKYPGGRVAAASEDLSTGGVFLRTTEVVPEGTRGTAVLKRPGRILGLRIPAVVARCVEGPPPGLGLRFELTDPRQTEEIRALIRRVLKTRKPAGALVTPVLSRESKH